MGDEKCWFSRAIAGFSVKRDVAGTLTREGAEQQRGVDLVKGVFLGNQKWQLITI